MRKFYWIGLLLIIILSGIGFYGFTNSALSGKVVDSLSGKPLVAQVRTSYNSARTAKSGHFLLRGRAGVVQLVVYSPGYEKQTANINVPFLIGKNIGTVRLKNGIIIGSITEDAIRPLAISTATVSFGKLNAIAINGKVKIKDVPIGKQIIEVKAPGHERFEKEVRVKSGTNPLLIRLSLTSAETLRRFLTALQFQDYAEAYEYAHPDVAAYMTRESYIEKLQKDARGIPMEIVSFSTGQSIMLPEWTFSKNGKTYKDVAEIETTITYKIPLLGLFSGSDERIIHQKIHLIKLGRQWKAFIKDQR